MVRSGDGRIVGARRNGHCFVSILDDRGSSHFTLDFARAEKLAESLERPGPCSVPDINAQVLTLQVVQPRVSAGEIVPQMPSRLLTLGKDTHEPYGRPQQPTGPWTLTVDQGVQLAAEIRQAVKD